MLIFLLRLFSQELFVFQLMSWIRALTFVQTLISEWLLVSLSRPPDRLPPCVLMMIP